MSESFAPAPTWGDGVALEMDHPSLAWLYADIPTVVNIAQLQPHESVLILSCSTGLLAVAALKALGDHYRRIVGVDSVRGALQQAALKFEASGIGNDIELLHSNFYDLNSLTGLQVPAQDPSPPAFDVVFARNALPPGQSDWQSLLQYWASHCTHGTGRLVTTFSHGDTENPHLAGIQAVDNDSNIVACTSWMFERE